MPIETKKTQEREDLFFTFDINDASADVNIRVTQPFKRMIKDTKYEYSPLIF